MCNSLAIKIIGLFVLLLAIDPVVADDLCDRGKINQTAVKSDTWMKGSVVRRYDTVSRLFSKVQSAIFSSFEGSLQQFGQLCWSRPIKKGVFAHFVCASDDCIVTREGPMLNGYCAKSGRLKWITSLKSDLGIPSHIWQSAVLRDTATLVFAWSDYPHRSPLRGLQLNMKNGMLSRNSGVSIHSSGQRAIFQKTFFDNAKDENRVSHCGRYFIKGTDEKRLACKRLQIAAEQNINIIDQGTKIRNQTGGSFQRVYGLRLRDGGYSCSIDYYDKEWPVFSLRNRHNKCNEHIFAVKWKKVGSISIQTIVQLYSAVNGKLLWEKCVEGMAVIDKGPFLVEDGQSVLYEVTYPSFYKKQIVKRSFHDGELQSKFEQSSGFVWLISENYLFAICRRRLYAIKVR